MVAPRRERVPLYRVARKHGLQSREMEALLKRHGVSIQTRQAGQQIRKLVSLRAADELVAKLLAEPEICPGCDGAVEFGRRWHRACAVRDRGRTRPGDVVVPLTRAARELGLSYEAARAFLERRGVRIEERSGGRWGRRVDVDLREFDELVAWLLAEPELCPGCGKPVKLGEEWHSGCRSRARNRARDPEQIRDFSAAGPASLRKRIALVQADEEVIDEHQLKAYLKTIDLEYSSHQILNRAHEINAGSRRPGCGRKLFFTVPEERDKIAAALRQFAARGPYSRVRDRVHAEDRLLVSDVAKRVKRSESKVHRIADIHHLGRDEGHGMRSFSDGDLEDIKFLVDNNQMAAYYNDPGWSSNHHYRRFRTTIRWAENAAKIAVNRGKRPGRPLELDAAAAAAIRDVAKRNPKLSNRAIAKIVSSRLGARVSHQQVGRQLCRGNPG
jgi:hypothetical protein